MRMRDLMDLVEEAGTVLKRQKIALKDGRTAEFVASRRVRPAENPDDGDWETVDISVSVDGEHAGHARFEPNKREEEWSFRHGTWSCQDVFVNKDFQRMGIATAMYAMATKLVGKIVRSHKLKPDGASFWEKQRDPKTAKYHLYWKAPKKPRP